MTTALQKWFILYSENHQNPVNKKIHYTCVPLIYFSVLGMMSSVEIPIALGEIFYISLGLHYFFLAGVLIFFLRHSFCIFLGMLMFSLICLMLINLVSIQAIVIPWQIFALLFTLSWIGQFIGHKIEKKKPSFFTDLVFLLIGPAWIVKNIFRKLELEY